MNDRLKRLAAREQLPRQSTQALERLARKLMTWGRRLPGDRRGQAARLRWTCYFRGAVRGLHPADELKLRRILNPSNDTTNT